MKRLSDAKPLELVADVSSDNAGRRSRSQRTGGGAHLGDVALGDELLERIQRVYKALRSPPRAHRRAGGQWSAR